ncbi:MAG: FtsX-like permease family protein [Crocinitomicaceae bacterium]|nr:FtsX-like permease family protein [Crocinitomicaceae bacterium]
MAKPIDKSSRRGVKTSYISTIVGVSLVLFMIGLVSGGYFGLDNIQRQAKENLTADIFFKPDLNDADIKQIELELKTWNEFSEVTNVSADRALEDFAGEGRSEEIMEILDGDRPIPTNISFKPKEKHANIEGMNALEAKILSQYGDRVIDVNYQESSIEEVNLGFKQIVLLFAIVAALLIVIAVAMINSTIRLALYSKRFSIKTMQLVGATSRYIRRPFLWQAVGIGIISGIIGMAILLGLFYALNNVMDSIEIPFDIISFFKLLGTLLISGVLITLVSTWFALNKYLRMKLDDLY